MSGTRQSGSANMSHGGMTGSGMSTDGMMTPAVHTGVIRMRGLPFSATKQDVINFFQGLTRTRGVGLGIGLDRCRAVSHRLVFCVWTGCMFCCVM